MGWNRMEFAGILKCWEFEVLKCWILKCKSLKNAEMLKGAAYVAGPDTNTVLNKQIRSAYSHRSSL